ncbi:urate hydroxylase PuuD [Pseudogemmobacter sonorensis]|uniref:urate hydroxylase PuuD n=1 Tax=Pseudogemmobacter sonorensis TaxID=2989681 RepID=UPI0036D17976
MTDFAVIIDWLSLVARWSHIAAAMAWFGAAFFFRSRELRLRPAPDLPADAIGSSWMFHGGGYIRSVKYHGQPEYAPTDAPLFKWESYFTWLTGFLLLALIYYTQARLFLIDEDKAALSPGAAIAISVGSLIGGWILYDLICKVAINWRGPWLDLLVFALMMLASWGYHQLFTGRAATLHLGALLATIMVGNVFFVVIRNGKRAMAALRAGETPDPADRNRLQQRGRHTRYLHLPILFLMVSVHYPLAFGTEWSWVLPGLVLVIGHAIGNGFETYYSAGRMPAWPWAAAAILTIVMMWITSDSRFVLPRAAAVEALSENARFAEVADVVAGRCSMCHGAEPAWGGVGTAPKHVLLDSPAGVLANAREIYLQAGLSTAMPPGNVTWMTADERALILDWYQDAAR